MELLNARWTSQLCPFTREKICSSSWASFPSRIPPDPCVVLPRLSLQLRAQVRRSRARSPARALGLRASGLFISQLPGPRGPDATAPPLAAQDRPRRYDRALRGQLPPGPGWGGAMTNRPGFREGGFREVIMMHGTGAGGEGECFLRTMRKRSGPGRRLQLRFRQRGAGAVRSPDSVILAALSRVSPAPPAQEPAADLVPIQLTRTFSISEAAWCHLS